MIIDEKIIKDSITVPLLAKLIERHSRTIERYAKLRNYYEGKHDILNRRQTSAGLANNKIVCNHAKYIVDMTVSYLLGNPVTYSPSEEYNIEAVKNAYLEQDIARVDIELEKTSSICGRAYELVYMNEDSKPRSVHIPPEQAFVVYNDDCTHIPLFGVYYYKTYDIDGNISGVVCNLYTDSKEFTYESPTDNWNNMIITYEGRHFFNEVPLIEYENNSEKQGDFEQLIPLIDAYNKQISDRVNDKEQFVDAFLFLKNVEVDSDGARKLRQEKILMAEPGEHEEADAKYLSKVLSEADMKVQRDDLKEDIHRFAMVPDLSDANFSGNQSGVAIRYKLLTFEQHIKAKEGYFSNGLKKRFEIYSNILSTKSLMSYVPIHRVDVVFTHNLPANNLETAQMINALDGTVTQETLIGQLDFVGDPKEEAELARKEQMEKSAENTRIIEQSRRGVSYNEE